MVLEAETWKQELKTRAGHLWAGKMFATLGAIAVFFYAYFWVMRHPLSGMTVMPVIWIDDLVAFSPASFVVYVSLWVYVGLGPQVAKDARDLAAWGAVAFAMAVVGLGIFLALPTRVPDFGVDWSRWQDRWDARQAMFVDGERRFDALLDLLGVMAPVIA